MGYIGYLFFRVFIVFISLCTFRGVYYVSDFLCFFVYRIWGYRKAVVRANLKKVFPEKSELERLQIEKEYYEYLCDLMVESFKSYSLSEEDFQKQYIAEDLEKFEDALKKYNDILLVCGHCGNWEWAAITVPRRTSLLAQLFYKPLANKWIDAYIRKKRSVGGGELISIKDTAEAFAKKSDKKRGFMLMSDQSPSKIQRAIWVDFFGIDTACVHGAERYSRMYNMPVYYLYIERVGRGKYVQHSEIITDQPLTLNEGEITQRYMKLLERDIRNKPYSWLWSHKRWKHKRDQQNKSISREESV